MKKDYYNAYFTVEGSFIFPMLMLLYFLIVMAALLLFARCLTSQNDYILALRGARLSYGAEDYGEVIYGESGDSFAVSGYVLKRLKAVGNTYPVYTQLSSGFEKDGAYAVLTTGAGSKIGRNDCVKRVKIINPTKKEH